MDVTELKCGESRWKAIFKDSNGRILRTREFQSKDDLERYLDCYALAMHNIGMSLPAIEVLLV
jgi:hypothetical protein